MGRPGPPYVRQRLQLRGHTAGLGCQPPNVAHHPAHCGCTGSPATALYRGRRGSWQPAAAAAASLLRHRRREGNPHAILGCRALQRGKTGPRPRTNIVSSISPRAAGWVDGVERASTGGTRTRSARARGAPAHFDTCAGAASSECGQLRWRWAGEAHCKARRWPLEYNPALLGVLALLLLMWAEVLIREHAMADLGHHAAEERRGPEAQIAARRDRAPPRVHVALWSHGALLSVDCQ